MDSTSNKNTNANNTNNNQEREPFSYFNHPLTSYDHLPTFNPTSKVDERPSSSTQPLTSPAARSSKKRTRASRRAPTTVLTTDTSNFRSLVQQFTGFPTLPFPAPSPSFPSSLPYCPPVRPTTSSFVDSISAVNVDINRNISLENVINSSGSNTAALSSYSFLNPNTALAPKFGDLGGSSGGLSGWSECADHQDDSNIRCELGQPPYKRQATRGTEGAVIEWWDTNSSD